MGILEGKAVMITGAASGIGEATAKEAAAEGARLMLCDVDAEKGAADSANHGAGMNSDPIPDLGRGVQRHIGKQIHIFP